jgi:hypothetical protein
VNRSDNELIAAQRKVAEAKPKFKLVAWRREGQRLAHLAVAGIVDWGNAVDVLQNMAVGYGFVALHGDDFITKMIAIAIKWAAVLHGGAE